MIRMNLLAREEKVQRRAAIKFEAGDLVVPVALLAAAGLVIVGTVMSQRMSMASLGRSISEIDAQSRALAPQIARVNRLGQERAELDLRLGVISKLEQGRTKCVRLMDELARCVPDHLWLSGAREESGGSLRLEGTTFSNLVISDFMTSLEQSPMFANVELEVAEHGELAGQGVVKFSITCRVTPNEPVN